MKQLSLALCVLAVAVHAIPCTTFCLRGEHGSVFGKNYDWSVGDGLLVVNKQNVERTALIEGGSRPATWVSHHGSVTFNQYGRGLPSGGINEAGLVVELMWLEGARYPEADERPAIGCLGWIQYQLDRHATVAEVIRSNRAIRIESSTPLHYLVADASGAVATIEFLDGRLVANTGASLDIAALANSTYKASLGYLSALDKKSKSAPRNQRSLSRFARAAQRVRTYSEGGATDSIGFAFETLRLVAGPRTQWSIVYEIEHRRLHFRTLDHPGIRTLDLGDLDFACTSPVQVFDLHQDITGDIADDLEVYTLAANQSLIRSSFAKTYFLRDVKEETIERIALHPESDSCLRGSVAGR